MIFWSTLVRKLLYIFYIGVSLLVLLLLVIFSLYPCSSLFNAVFMGDYHTVLQGFQQYSSTYAVDCDPPWVLTHPRCVHIIWSTPLHMWEQPHDGSRKPEVWSSDTKELWETCTWDLLRPNVPPVSHWASPCGRCPSPSPSSSPCTPAETDSLMQTHTHTQSRGSKTDRLKSQFCDEQQNAE